MTGSHELPLTALDDVLRTRYASPEMAAIWSLSTRIATARVIWLTVLAEQLRWSGELAPDHAGLSAYHGALADIDLDAHLAAEQRTGHETKAWLEVYNQQAGFELLHRGMTSSDITENVHALQINKAMDLIQCRAVAVLSRLSGLIGVYAKVPMVARTHNVPAQATTLGYRFATTAQDILGAMIILEGINDSLVYRGIRGAVGTGADMRRVAAALTGDPERSLDANSAVAETLGFPLGWAATGQVPPRSQDHAIAGAVAGLCSGPASSARTLRLMAGAGLGQETMPAGATGSTAMPHKTNPRYAERVAGLMAVVRGFAAMIGETAGDTWNEGDVSYSSTRRIAWPGLFLAADGLLRSYMVALDRFDPDLAAIDREFEQHRVEMLTGRLLELGSLPREAKHAAIRDWYRRGGLPSELAQQLGVRVEVVLDALAEAPDTGSAEQNCQAVIDRLQGSLQRNPESAGYEPAGML